MLNRLKATGSPVEVASGGLTKFNCYLRQIPKTHRLDATCVGDSTPMVLHWQHVSPLAIKAMGHGKRQVSNVDAYGFPGGKPKGIPVHPFRTVDILRAEIPKGIYAGTYVSRIAETKTTQMQAGFKSKTGSRVVCHTKYLTKLFNVDGYEYSLLQRPARQG